MVWLKNSIVLTILCISRHQKNLLSISLYYNINYRRWEVGQSSSQPGRDRCRNVSLASMEEYSLGRCVRRTDPTGILAYWLDHDSVPSGLRCILPQHQPAPATLWLQTPSGMVSMAASALPPETTVQEAGTHGCGRTDKGRQSVPHCLPRICLIKCWKMC